MELYHKHLDYPKRIRKGWFISTLLLLYGLFCLDLTDILLDHKLDYDLFLNDFRGEGYLAWFVGGMLIYLFQFITFRCATIMIKDRLIKSIFYALTIDAAISMVNVLLFGLYNPIVSILIRNGFVVLAMLYAYFILPNEN